MNRLKYLLLGLTVIIGTSFAGCQDKWKPSSLEDVKKYAPGIWTFNEIDSSGRGSWIKLDINADGTMEIYNAYATDDNWGKPEQINWEPKSEKYISTGENAYGVSIPNDLFVLTGHNTLHQQMDYQHSRTFTRGDTSPFSKVK